MSQPDEAIVRAAHRGFATTLGIGALIALLAFLVAGGFFDSYHGVAVGHRPLQGSDGVGDEVKRFVLDHPSGGWSEVVLPVEAFADHTLPLTPRGVPPVEIPDDAPTVSKELFSLAATVNGEPVSTSGVGDAVLPMLFLLVLALGRNVVITGSPFRMVPSPDQALPIPVEPPKREPKEDGPRRRRSKPKKGPPPPNRRRRRR